MPQKKDDCVEKLIAEGKSESSAWAICNSSIDAAMPIKYQICPDSGFMRVMGVCARSGVQEYFGHELGLEGENTNKVFGVLRPVDEVAASLSTYNGAVITDNHPSDGIVLIDENHKILGNVSESEGYEEEGEYYIIAKATITDSNLIEKVKSGKQELSAGYTRDLLEESGEHNGQPYHFVQRNIKVNHVAVVDEGRCGAKCKLNLDKKGEHMGIKIQLDGKSVTMDEAEVSKYIDDLNTQKDEAMAESEKNKEALDVEMTEKGALEEQIAVLTEKLSGMQETLSKMLSMEEAEAMAEESTEIATDAEELGVETKEKSNDAKRKEIIASVSGSKHSLDSLTGEALKTVYRISVDQAKTAKKLQADGYKGTEAKQAPVRTGELSNDLNSIAAAARKEKKGAK